MPFCVSMAPPVPRAQTQLLIDSGPTFSFCLSRFYVLGSAMRAGQALGVHVGTFFVGAGQVRSSWTPSHYVAPHPSRLTWIRLGQVRSTWVVCVCMYRDSLVGIGQVRSN